MVSPPDLSLGSGIVLQAPSARSPHTPGSNIKTGQALEQPMAQLSLYGLNGFHNMCSMWKPSEKCAKKEQTRKTLTFIT